MFIDESNAKTNSVAVKKQSTKKTSKQRATKQTVRNETKQTAAAQQKKTSLENQQKSIKGQLSSMKAEIATKEERMRIANDELKRSELAISRSNRTLKELSEKKDDVENQLKNLKEEAKIVGLHVQEAEDVIGQIAQAQFLNSRKQSWQNAIAGGNPNDAKRKTAILSYMAVEQNRTIDRLENRQKNIEAVARKTEQAQARLLGIERAEKHNREELQKEKAERTIASEKLRQEITSQKERYEQLVKNDEELTRLITDISRQIAAIQEAAKKRVQEESHRRKQRSQSLVEDTRPIAHIPYFSSINKLRGTLLKPTNGPVVSHFGKRQEGVAASLLNRGIQIRATAGSPVYATLDGTVVYSNWLRGYGNMIILDHGQGLLSVYAKNETLYKSIHDTVRRGDVIASVGSSGGEEEPGLYFELRYKDKPQDPMLFIGRSK